MKFFSHSKIPTLFDLDAPLEKLSKSNRWVKLADALPWNLIEKEYNQRLDNKQRGAGNKPARMVVGALIIKHICCVSDRDTITIIQENPYMQYFVGLPYFIDEPIFDPSLFVTVRKRLDPEFFNHVTTMIAKAEKQSKEKESPKDKDDNQGMSIPADSPSLEATTVTTHKGVLKADATCCDAEMCYPTDYGLLENASDFLYRMLKRFCDKVGIKVPANHRPDARAVYLSLIKKKHKGKKLRDSVLLSQIRFLEADIQCFFRTINSDFSNQMNKAEACTMNAVFELLRQQKYMFSNKVRRCKDRIVSIYQPHVRPIVRGKTRSNVEFGAKVGAAVAGGFTYLDNLSWDAYNESADLITHIVRYRDRFGFYPEEIQADKIYLTKENRLLLRELQIKCHCPALGRPPKQVDLHAKEMQYKASCERNEVEATFGTGKRVYRANNIRAKRANTAFSWIGACFFAKNIMKFLRGLLAPFFKMVVFLLFTRDFFQKAPRTYHIFQFSAI